MPNGCLHIEVEDTGVGMRPEELERIFDAFYQTPESALTDKPGGTGLGLAICRQIAEHYNGTISATSTPGRGSTFVFTVPARQGGASS